jgi:hypothetical protein
MFRPTWVHGRHAVVLVGVDAVDHRLGQHRGALALGRLHVVDAGVHRADRADGLAVVVAAAGRAALPRNGVAALGNGHRSVAVRVDHLREAAVAIAPRDHVHRVGAAALCRRLLRRVVRARHAHALLGAAVVGLQFVVGDGPVAPDAVDAPHAQVDRQMAPRRGRPVPGRAADHAQVALQEAAAARTAGGDVVVLRKVEQRGRQRRLRVGEPVVGIGKPVVGAGVAVFSTGGDTPMGGGSRVHHAGPSAQ